MIRITLLFPCLLALACGGPLTRLDPPSGTDQGRYQQVAGTAADDLWTWGLADSEPDSLRLLRRNDDQWMLVPTPAPLEHATGEVRGAPGVKGELWLVSATLLGFVVVRVHDDGTAEDFSSAFPADPAGTANHPQISVHTGGGAVLVQTQVDADAPLDAELRLFENGTWRLLPAPPAHLRIGLVSAANDLWGSVTEVNGSGGTLFHFDGSAWTDTGEMSAGAFAPISPTNLWALFGPAPDEREGTGWNTGHWDGSAWEHVRVMPEADDESLGLYGATASHRVGFLAGDGRDLLLVAARFVGDPGGAGESKLFLNRWREGEVIESLPLGQLLEKCESASKCLPPLRMTPLSDGHFLLEQLSTDRTSVVASFVASNDGK